MIDKFLEETLEYPIRIASSNSSLRILFGGRLNQLNKKDAIYITRVMKTVIEHIADLILEEIKPSENISDTKNYLIRGFTYCFDKSLEIVYNLLVANGEEVNFDLEEMNNGMSGDKIPEYIQMKVTPIIPIIATIFNKTFEFAKNTNSNKKGDTKELIKAILYGGMQLGTEFCFRIDLDDHSEFEKYMNN